MEQDGRCWTDKQWQCERNETCILEQVHSGHANKCMINETRETVLSIPIEFSLATEWRVISIPLSLENVPMLSFHPYPEFCPLSSESCSQSRTASLLSRFTFSHLLLTKPACAARQLESLASNVAWRPISIWAHVESVIPIALQHKRVWHPLVDVLLMTR
jgi:hypothetical protein